MAFGCNVCESAAVKDEKGREISNYVKESWGCENPLDVPRVLYDEGEEWYNCPMRFVCKSALDFVEEYDSYKGMIAAPLPLGQQSAKFFDAVRLFEYYIKRFTEEKTGKAEQNDP